MGIGAEGWAGAGAVARVEECTRVFIDKLTREGEEVKSAAGYTFNVVGVEILEDKIAIRLEPASSEDWENVIALRVSLAGLFGARSDGEGDSGFLITLAYLLRYLGDEDKREILRNLAGFEDVGEKVLVGRAEFCVFEDVFAYKRLLLL